MFLFIVSFSLARERPAEEKDTMRAVADQHSHRELVASVLEIVPDVAYFVDTHGIVQYVNRAGQSAAGTAPAVGTDVATHPTTRHAYDGADRPLAWEDTPYYRSLHGGETCHDLELVVRLPGAAPRPLRVSSAPLRQDGTTLGVVITERRAADGAGEPDSAEHGRREAVARLQAEITQAEYADLAHVLEQLPVGIFIAEGETEGRTMRWNFINPAGQQQLQAPNVTPGVTSETFNVLHPDGRPYAEDELPIQHTLWTGRPVVQQEMVFRYHTGEERTFAATTNVLREENGTREVIEVLQDITARHRAETALRQSEERFARAFHANPDPLHITRLADSCILDVNARWLEVTGFERDEVVGRTVLELGLWVNPAGRDRITRLLQQDGSVRDQEAVFRMKSGEIRECLISVELIETEGEPCALSMVHDVTDQKRLEERVRRQAEAIQGEYKRLAAVIAHVDVALALVDGGGRIQMVNDSWEGLHGCTRAEALERRYAEVIDSPIGRQLQAQIDQVLATGEPVRAHESFVQDAVHPYGVYLDWTIQPIRGPGGAVAGALSVAVDVTEKVRTRRQIEEQRTLLETIFESTPIGIILFDREMRILDLNAEYARMAHLDPPTVRGRRLYDIAPAARDRAHFHARVLAGEVIDQDSVPYPAPDGSIRYYDILYRPVRGAGGTVTGILSAATDVTEKVRNREELEDQRALLETIIATTPVGIAFYNAELRVVNLNATWARMVGVEMAAARNQPLYKVAPALRERAAVHRRVLSGEAIDLVNVPYDLPGAEEPRYYDLSFRPVRDADGEITGALIAAVDVTERHELDRQKDEFIALASHELKTPITAIKGYAQTGLRVVGQSGDERLIRTLRIIDDQSNRLTRLINDLLDVSRMESGALTFYHEPFDLRRLVYEVVNNLRLTAPDFSITERLPTSPAPVDGDPQRLEQVVTNLVQNAIKYSGAARRIEVTMTCAGGEVITAVRDFGVGIPAAQQIRVFERFFRGSNVSSRHYSGLGLGLFISQGIVTRHGGRMWLESAENQGSTFYFTLPLLRNEE
jgi:two-component system CheB/CheR fusion protein